MEVEKKLSVEDLMKPRYKVIADYPNSKFRVGGIIKMWRYDPVEKEYFDVGRTLESFFKQYPHLFKKLEWWEERIESDMPEYLRDNTSKPVSFLKVDKWHIDLENEGKEYWAHYNKKSHLMLMWAYTPIPESEYLTLNK